MSVSFDIGILPNRPVYECLELARAAEDFGYGGVWLADSQCVMRDAYTILSLIAMQTSSIRVATGVTNAITRHPSVLANSWATLDEISGGRAVMGIGVGESSIRTLGLKPDRLAALENKIGALRALMNGEEVELEGTFLPADLASMPGAGGDGLLWTQVTATGRTGRRRACCSRWVQTPPSYVMLWIIYASGAEQAGRKLDDVALYMRVATSVSSDRVKAREEIKGYAAVAAGTVFKTVPREYFRDDLWQELDEFKARYDYFEHGSNQARHRDLLTDTILDAISISGTPEEAVPRFQEIIDMGVHNFVWPANMPDAIHFLDEFAEKVMPNVK